MLSCEACELLLADALYNELNHRDEQRLNQHVDDCPTCRALYQELQASRAVLQDAGLDSAYTQRRDDKPTGSDMEDLWAKLQPELDAVDAARLRQLPQRHWTPYLTGALAMAASLLLFLFVFDLSIETGEPTPPQIAEAPTQMPAISPELMNYLAKAETMLLLVANAESDNVSVVPIRQTAAREMAVEAGYLTTTTNPAISAGQSRLLKDIEFMLMQIANLDEANMADGVRLLQQYIEDNSVFFKIRLLEMRNQNRLTQASTANEVLL